MLEVSPEGHNALLEERRRCLTILASMKSWRRAWFRSCGCLELVAYLPHIERLSVLPQQASVSTILFIEVIWEYYRKGP